jgi:predicted SAM-dependent methyltransferase
MEIFSIVNKILNKFNYRISKVNKQGNSNPDDFGKVLLNLGSGNWSLKRWINLDHPSEWYANAQKKHKIIPYDIRNDNIPFDDNSVDVIYCSHVIEHIENIHIQRMFKECCRVLKPEGVLRLACPDAEFLYQVSKCNNDYWNWRNEWFNSKRFYIRGKVLRNVDFLVREIATPKLLNYVYSMNNEDYEEAFNTMEMYDFLEYLTKDLSFRVETVGDHINYWTFDKAKEMLQKSGFSLVIRSKWSGSVSNEMKREDKFDITYPNMSLYVEAIKQ